MAQRPCPGLYQPISFKLPSDSVDPARFRKRGYLRGRVVDGKVVIENWTAKDVFQPQNVCWWEKVQKAKKTGRRTGSARRSK